MYTLVDAILNSYQLLWRYVLSLSQNSESCEWSFISDESRLAIRRIPLRIRSYYKKTYQQEYQDQPPKVFCNNECWFTMAKVSSCTRDDTRVRDSGYKPSEALHFAYGVSHPKLSWCDTEMICCLKNLEQLPVLYRAENIEYLTSRPLSALYRKWIIQNQHSSTQLDRHQLSKPPSHHICMSSGTATIPHKKESQKDKKTGHVRK